MTQALVRAARASDIPAITAIYDASVRQGTASFELDPPDEAEMRRRFDAIAGAGYPYLVAELGGRVVGYAYANAYRTPVEQEKSPEERGLYQHPELYNQPASKSITTLYEQTTTSEQSEYAPTGNK